MGAVPRGNGSGMTSPENDQRPDDAPEGAAVTGALAAASEHDDAAGDPLGPLNRVTEDDES